MRTAIFGGTFDPIHRAHLIVAHEAAAAFSLDRVLFIPAANPPHKEAGADYEDRYKMVELACAGEPRFIASRLEAGSEKSYSIRSIERVKAMGGEVFFVIGADAFAEIRTWHRWEDVVDAVDFIVVTRPGHAYTSPPGARGNTGRIAAGGRGVHPGARALLKVTGAEAGPTEARACRPSR